MLYEIKLKLTDRSGGEEKLKKEHYILDAELHAEAEKAGYDLYPNTDVDVFAVFRSDIREIINTKEEDKPFFLATVTDVQSDDAGKEREVKYKVLLCAASVAEATRLMEDYIRQGYDMRLDAIKRVKIEDYLV